MRVPQPFGRPLRGGRPVLLGALSSTAIAAAAIALSAPGGATAPSAGRAALAPAQAGAANGGKVIVMLADQHRQLRLVAQRRRRIAATTRDQAPIVASIEAHGGSAITQLVSVNAVAATLPAAEVARLRHDPAVARIVPDLPVPMDMAPAPAAPATAAADAAPTTPAPCPAASLTHPGVVQEPEADGDIHASTGNPNAVDMANSVATGKGVIVAISGMNNLAGNPNFTRADGSHVVLDAPSYTTDSSNDEAYLDGSSVAAQGTQTYQYSGALPQSSISPDCTFYIEGDAPDASLVDTAEITMPVNQQTQLLTDDASDASSATKTQSESQLIAGIDKVTALGPVTADVISESFGNSNFVPQIVYAANDAAVAAGIPVVVSSGDSGVSGTMNPMASDPNVISAGAVDNMRLIAMNDGFQSYQSNQIAALSSAGVSVNDRLVDLVAPGWFGEAACAPNKGGCPNYPTEAGRGTSEAAPLIAGAIADVIQAYRDTHGGASPTPRQDKELLTSTATDLDAPSAEQGSGLLNIYAAVKAAQQLPGTSAANGPGDAPGLVASPSQLDVTAAAGSTSSQTVSLYNASDAPTTVSGSYRDLGPTSQIGSTVTEDVSAPDPSLPLPPQGATAADPVTFTVPAGLGRLSLDMIWPDATNSNNLYVQLFDPEGVFVQESYDYGSAGRNGGRGSVSNSQFIDVSDPQPGQWTAKILWGGKDTDLAVAQIAPGSYRGPLSLGVWGQKWVSSPASGPITIPARSSVDVPLAVPMPGAAGDYPESVQFSGDNGSKLSYALTRRSLIPNGFGSPFDTLITSSVGRTIGQINQYNIDVPPSSASVSMHFTTADTAADNGFTYYLVDPNGKVVQSATTPQTVNGQPSADATLSAADPMPGRWQVDVKLNLTTSGLEFTQIVHGTATVTPETTVGGTVPATLALSLGSASASFGTFAPGVAQTYATSLTASVTSSAGSAALSASDPDGAHPGHLVNGAFTLPQGLQVAGSSDNAAASGGGTFSDLSTSDPATLLTYAAPVSNDPATIAFHQAIGANDALRTGSYAKTVTFTLATTQP